MRRLRRLVLYPLLTLGGAAFAALMFIALTNYPTQVYVQKDFLALTGATVLVGPNLEAQHDATVLIRDGTILAVGPRAEVEIPVNAETIDLSGMTLLPGLIDLHVHLGMPELQAGERMGLQAMLRATVDAVRHAPGARRSFLEHGVTTVRSLGDDRTWVLELRRMIADGELEGPRVYAAGPVFTTPGGHPIVTIHGGRIGDPLGVPGTPDEARVAVRHLAIADGGVDLIKVIQERGSPDRPLQPIAVDILNAIVEEAHAHGLPVIAHWGTIQDLEEVLRAGVDGLEHLDSRDVLDGWPDEALIALIARNLPLTPTLAVTEAAFVSREASTVLTQLQQRVAEFHAAGGRIVVGSDAAMPGVPFGRGVHRELELLVEAGLTPQQALRAATSAAAEALRADHFGMIEPGRAADLLAVRGNPLDDIGAIREVVAVWRDGRMVVDRRSLSGEF